MIKDQKFPNIKEDSFTQEELKDIYGLRRGIQKLRRANYELRISHYHDQKRIESMSSHAKGEIDALKLTNVWLFNRATEAESLLKSHSRYYVGHSAGDMSVEEKSKIIYLLNSFTGLAHLPNIKEHHFKFSYIYPSGIVLIGEYESFDDGYHYYDERTINNLYHPSDIFTEEDYLSNDYVKALLDQQHKVLSGLLFNNSLSTGDI